MFVKQGWRLQLQKDMLAFKALKARYFPKTSFSNAPMGSNPITCGAVLEKANSLLVEDLVAGLVIGGKFWLDGVIGYLMIYAGQF